MTVSSQAEWIGAKYLSGRKLDEISRLIQLDLAQAIKESRLPRMDYKVDLVRLSGRIDVIITRTPGILVLSPEYVTWQDSSARLSQERPKNLYTESGREVLRVVTGLVDQYNLHQKKEDGIWKDSRFDRYINFCQTLVDRQTVFIRGIDPRLRVTARHWREVSPHCYE